MGHTFAKGGIRSALIDTENSNFGKKKKKKNLIIVNSLNKFESL